jgi:hypothetical protein
MSRESGKDVEETVLILAAGTTQELDDDDDDDARGRCKTLNFIVYR